MECEKRVALGGMKVGGNRVNDQAYFDYCEKMWSKWISSDVHNSGFMETTFQIDHCPEPYLFFSSNAPGQLHFLTTNPGAGMPHQHFEQINQGKSVVLKNASYFENTKRLADFYSTQLPGNARVRVEAMRRLATLYGSRGFTQVECLPFHSRNLRQKNAIIQFCKEDTDLGNYIKLLKEYLLDKTVLAVSAVGSSKESACSEDYFSEWLRWQSEIMGFSFDAADKYEIVRHKTTGRVTGALLLSQRANASKGFFLMMGTNSLPSPEGVEQIAKILIGKQVYVSQ
jgi:hypothetical protein